MHRAAPADASSRHFLLHTKPTLPLDLIWSATATCSFSASPRSASSEILQAGWKMIGVEATEEANNQAVSANWALARNQARSRGTACLHRPNGGSPSDAAQLLGAAAGSAHLSHALLPCRQAPSMSIESSWAVHSAVRIHCRQAARGGHQWGQWSCRRSGNADFAFMATPSTDKCSGAA